MVVRIGIAAAGLILLLIIFAIIKSFLGGCKNFDDFITITQKQQELIHLSTGAGDQAGLSDSVSNFAITTQTGITTDQKDTILYLGTNGVKLKAKKLDLGISSSVDQQLEAAAGANAYSSTFKQVMRDQLESYMQQLQSTYAHTTGSHGRQLLSEEYNHAKLLVAQLDQPG